MGLEQLEEKKCRDYSRHYYLFTHISQNLINFTRRYEYRKYHVKGLGPSRLGRDRIEKLNAIGFQWRLRPERVPWEDRFHVRVRVRVRVFLRVSTCFFHSPPFDFL